MRGRKIRTERRLGRGQCTWLKKGLGWGSGWLGETVLSSKEVVVAVEFPNTTTFIDLAPFSRRYSGGEGLGMRGLKESGTEESGTVH